MNSVLTKYRELMPDDGRDDATLTYELGQAFEERGVDFAASDPDFAKSYDFLKDFHTPSLGQEFARGVKRGIDQTQSTYYGGAALVADSLGWEGGREWAMEGYQRNQEQAQENAATISSYKDVDSFGDGVRFVTGLAGETLISGAEAIASGVISGGVGAPIAKQVAKRQIKKTIAKRATREASSEGLQAIQEKARKKLIDRAAKKGAARAAAFGATGSSVLQNTGETYGEIYDTAATRGDRIKAALAAGAIAGALDAAVPITVLRRIFHPSVAKGMAEDQIKKQGLELMGQQLDKAFEGYAPLKRKFFSALAKSTGGEAITEAAQELVQEAAQAYADPDYKYNPEELRERLINAAIAGAVGGSQFGGATATIDTYRQSGTNKRLNDFAKTYEDLMLAQRQADRGDLASLDALNAQLEEDFRLDTDLLTLTPVESENNALKDLIDFVSSENSGGEGPVGALIKYQDPETNEWRNAYVRGESMESIVQEVQAQGVQNAEIVQVSDDTQSGSEGESTTTEAETSEPTEEEIASARDRISREGINLDDFNEEDQDAIIYNEVIEERGREVIGQVPTVPEPTREAILEAMREESARIDADESLSDEEKQDAKLDLELSVQEELAQIGEEFTGDGEAIRQTEGNIGNTQDEGTNTPQVATEESQVTPSPVADPKLPDLKSSRQANDEARQEDSAYEGDPSIPLEGADGIQVDRFKFDKLPIKDKTAESALEYLEEFPSMAGSTAAVRARIKYLLQRKAAAEAEAKEIGKEAAYRKWFSTFLDKNKSLKEEDIEVLNHMLNILSDDVNFPQTALPDQVVDRIEAEVESNSEIGNPISLDQEYSDFSFMPSATLEGRDIHQELAAAHATVDSDGKPTKSKRFTRRAAVLRNTQTGQIEVRGAYSTDKGKVTLHGVETGQGDSLENALSGWRAEDKKRGSHRRFGIDRAPHELVGIIEFDGVAVPSDKDQKLFDKINQAGTVTPEDQVKLDGIARRRAGYGQIYQTYPDLETFNQQTEGRFTEPRETMSERTERGEVDVVNPGEYLENLESISTGAVGLSESDSQQFDPELLLSDEVVSADPQQAMQTLANEHGMPFPEIEQALDELDSIDSDGSLEDIAQVFYSPDGGKTFPDFPAFTSYLQSVDQEVHERALRESFKLLQKLQQNARSKQNSEEGGRGDQGGSPAPVSDLQQGERESGRTEGQDAGATDALSGQEANGSSPVSERERGRSNPDPEGDRARRERALEWERVGDGHVAYAGDFIFSVDGGPKVWDLRIANLSEEEVLYNEAFIGDLDAAILATEQQLAKRLQSEPAPLAENAPSAVTVQDSTAQPDIQVPEDKPKLRVIQSDQIPQVTDRVGDAYPLDEVGKQGVNLALAAHANGRPGFLNSDGTGVGKSRQAIAIMQEVQQKTGGRILYVTENAQQITKFQREMAVMGVTNPRIEFTTYNQIGRGKLVGRKFSGVVFDEAHNLKNAQSKKSEAAAQIQSDFTMFMTATPMDKVEAAAYFISTIKGVDEETILNQIGLERAVNERKDGSFYTVIQKQSGVTNGEIRNRLNDLRNGLIAEGAMIRREYPFYGARDVINISLSEDQLAQQDTINSYWDSRAEEGGGRNVSGQRLLDLNRWVEPMKADEIYERMRDDLANGRSVVIVGETVDNQWVSGIEGGPKGDSKATYPGLLGSLAARLESDGVPFSKIYGSGNKSKAVDSFQSGETKVALMTPKSGGAGIDLDDQSGGSPRSVYVATVNFSGDVFEQIMGRFSRRNTMSPTKLSFVTMPDVDSERHRSATLEEKLANLSTFQGKEATDQDADIRDIFSDNALDAPSSSRSFRDWFGDSKVVDADGEPLIVYHGTARGKFSDVAKQRNAKRKELQSKIKELRLDARKKNDEAWDLRSNWKTTMSGRKFEVKIPDDWYNPSGFGVKPEKRGEVKAIEREADEAYNKYDQLRKESDDLSRQADKLRKQLPREAQEGEVFRLSEGGKTDFGYAGRAFYFTESKELAESYSHFAGSNDVGVEKNPYVYEVYLSIQNPYRGGNPALEKRANEILDRELKKYPPREHGDVLRPLMAESRRVAMVEFGHDGYIGEVSKGDGVEYVAFNANQIKSIHNQNPTALSDDILSSPKPPSHPISAEAAPIRSFNRQILPESRINTTQGIDYEINRITQPSPFLVDQHIDTIATEFGADAGARAFIRNILEAIPGEKLQTLDLRVVDDPDLPAGRYYPDRRMLILNKADPYNGGNGIALAFTHEMGHFFVNEVIGFDFVKDQWQSLTNEQRAASWKQYLDAMGAKVDKVDGAALVSDETAAQEWAAFQFTRIARAGQRNRDTLTKQMRKEGLSQGIIDTLTSWYDQLRQWIDQWIGDADLSTTDLDEAIMNALGIESDESSMRADAKRQQQFLAERAAESGYASIEEFAIEDVRKFGEAAREYRSSKNKYQLNAPTPERDPIGFDRGPRLTYSLPNGELSTEPKLDPRGHLEASIRRQKKGYVRRGDGSHATQKRSARSLETWADSLGIRLDRAAFEEFTSRLVETYGSEHSVYFDPVSERVIKTTHSTGNSNFGHSKNALDYLYGLASANKLFNDDIRLEGILIGEDGIQIVTSQPIIEGDKPTRDQIHEYLTKKLGLKKDNVANYVDQETGVKVSDIAPANAMLVKNEDGSYDIIPFDFQVEAPEGYIDGDALNAPSGHRNPNIQKNLKEVDRARANNLAPETSGRPAEGKKIVAENAWATHEELNQVALRVYDAVRRQQLFDGDFDTFYKKFTKTPITPSEARQYINNLEAGHDAVERTDLSPERQRVVDDYLVTELHETRKELEQKLQDDTQKIAAKERVIETQEAKVEKLQKQFNDAEALERGAVDELKAYLKGFKKAIGAKGGAAKLGRLGEIIKQLEGKSEIDNRIARKYTIGIERLIASEEPFVLFDLLEAVADSEVNLKGNATTVRNRFADAGISSVASLSDEKFAAVLSIAQADRYLLDTIILRKLPDAQEKLAIVESEVAETKGDFKRSSKAITKIKKHAALKGRLAGERAAAKGKIARAKAYIKKRDQERAIAKQAFEVYDSEFNKVAARTGGTVQGHVTDGTRLFVPASTDATKSDILGTLKTFRYGETTDQDITQIMAAQRRWLDGPNAEANREADPLFYNQVLTQSARLTERTFKDIHTKGTSFTGRLYFDSLANMFRGLNLPAGNAVAQMLQRVEARTSAWRNESTTIGEQVDKARYNLGRALGLDKTPAIFTRQFADRIDTPMKDYMEQPGATISGFISSRFSSADAATKRLIERYYEAELKNAKFIRRITEESMQQAGLGSVTNNRLMVPDHANDGKPTAMEQTHRNLGTGTFLIRPNMDQIGVIVEEFGSAEQIGSVMRELKNNEELSIEDARSLIDNLFQNPDSFDRIVGALARKEKVPVFTDSEGNLIAREDASEAFENAESPSAFFESLYSSDDVVTSEEFNAYLSDQLSEVYRLYNDIAKADEEYTQSKKSPTSGMSGHVAIDARKKDDWPAEWLSYRQGGATANNIIVSQNVIASIFGKDGERIQKEKASILSALRDKKLRARKEGNLREEGRIGKELERANSYFAQLDEVLGSQLGPLQDIKIVMELMNTLVGGVLNGPRSAMVQLNQIYQPILHFGLSGTTFRMMKTQAKTAAQDLFGSFFEALGVTIDRDNEAFKMQKDLYGLEPDKVNGFLGFTGEMGNEGKIGSAQRKVRLFNTLMSRRGISRAKAEDALYSSFKPWAPFSQFIGALHKAPMVAFRSEFDRMAGLAIQHADRVMPEAGDLTRLNFDHKALGFRSKDEFDKLNTILQEKVGTTLADVVARYRANRGGAPFTRDQYITMSSVGLDLMASEANVFTTRSPQMHTKMGRFVFPLLGWAIHQPHHAAKMFKGAEGEWSMRATQAGLLTLTFGLVPAVMAMAMFEDWFDEEIMGKKRNLRPLTGAGPLGTANAVLERVTRNGMLGMPMEFVNLGLNIGGEGDLRTASLDQRVFLAGTIRGMIQIVGNTAHQKTLTWDSGGRRLLQNVGANGFLQQIDMFSTLLELDNPESRTIARINANNYLRVGGRMIGLESRPFSGSVRPTPMTPWVTKMQIAAQANDGDAFQAAYLKALEAARKHLDKTGPREAEDYVARNWSSRHPLKGPFRSPPTPTEYQRLLQAIGENGARDVRELIDQYNRFGQRIGAKPYNGKTVRRGLARPLTMREIAGLPY